MNHGSPPLGILTCTRLDCAVLAQFDKATGWKRSLERMLWKGQRPIASPCLLADALLAGDGYGRPVSAYPPAIPPGTQ